MTSHRPSTPAAAGDRAPSRESFRNAMSRLATAVHIVTTDGPQGRLGFTVSAVCSVTDTPPTLLVCVNRNASALEAMLEHGRLCVNTLHTSQQAISAAFSSGVPAAERFQAGQWLTTSAGMPRLEDALVAFDCEIDSAVEQGTHKVLFCRVTDVFEGRADNALVYFARAYHDLRRRD